MTSELFLTLQITKIIQIGAAGHRADLKCIQPVLNGKHIRIRQPISFLLQLYIQLLVIILPAQPLGLLLCIIQSADEPLLNQGFCFKQRCCPQDLMLFV
ncbi:hypothetical protein D3C75_359760 [compost metagenome]